MCKDGRPQGYLVDFRRYIGIACALTVTRLYRNICVKIYLVHVYNKERIVAPPRSFLSNQGSEFHVPGQNYGTQPGGQVGGGGGSVGVPGGRGPPPLGGIQSIAQSATGIPPGGPTSGQAPPQAQAPGVQTQQPQGPAPTTTPPVHTPSPQEMGKQPHLPTQPPPLSQVYVQPQTRPATQNYYQAGPRPQQQRSLNHRGTQGNSGNQVVGMPGVGGGGGQPTAMYPTSLTVQPGTMYVPSQVPGLHTGPHQQPVYPMNNVQYPGPPQRHQTHQGQSFYQPFQPHALITTPNMFSYGAAPQHSYFFQPPNTPISLNRTNASAVSGGAHVGGPLTSAQGPTVVPQGTLQQPTQQPQPLPTMGIPLSQTDVYSGHNIGATNATNSATRLRKPRGQNAILDIVNPETGKNISDEIYCDKAASSQSGESSNRETPQPQNSSAELIVADFAARVAKAATEGSDSGSPVSASAPEISTSQNATQNLSNVQTNSNNDTNSQCNTGPSTPTQNIPNVSALCNQSLSTTSNVAPIDTCTVKPESKPLQLPVKEFQPRNEIKTTVVTEEQPTIAVAIVNKDNIPVQPAALASTPITELEVKTTSASSNVTPTSVPLVTVPSMTVPEVPKPSVTAPSANPVPAREPFPNLSSKTSSSSPPRRKSQTHAHNQAITTGELSPSSAKDQRERKTREKSLSSRGTTPTPTYSQPDHHHQKANGDAIGDRSESEAVPRNEIQQKSSDGKAMQKQKNKNKVKLRELNRKGAEKEGTDMDAFVNTVPTSKVEIKSQDNKESVPTKDSNKEAVREITRDIKEKDNYESKKEKEITSVHSKVEKHVTSELSKESIVEQTPVIEKLPCNKEPLIKESFPKIEDNSKSQNLLNTQVKSVPNDVVDHATVKEEIDVEAIVAQKNEENSKVSGLRVSNEEKPPVPLVIDKQIESETTPAPADIVPKTPSLALKYTYKEDQWSPINKSGKKVYDREFLMKLMHDPNSKIKPSNLPDLEVVLKDSTKARNTVDLRPFKDINLSRHDALFPGFLGFAKQNVNRMPPSKKNPPGGKLKSAKPNLISLSLREDVKLRETENAWRPARFKQINLTEEEEKTEALYKRFRSVLNKLTPQKFNTLVDQVRTLTIDTEERLQGVINLVFEKAVDEPSFSVEYALLCKELAMMRVSGTETDPEKQNSSLSFKKLIVVRCQKEFEKNSLDEVARINKLKEIEECTDPEKKKDLQIAFEEEERRIRVKSVGNIRFIGELYKQGILIKRIMHSCIKHLLDQCDEDSLECVCKLLTTIGKDLESKSPQNEMQEYFNKMEAIVARRGAGKISSRIRFMLQDVIDLKANKWIPRRDDNNPKTIDQIQKEAELERLDIQLNNTPLNTPRKDDRNNDRKRNRIGPADEGGWSQPVGRTRTTYSVETAKLKNKPPPMDDLQLGSRHLFLWKSNPSMGSSKTSSNKYALLENMSTLDQDKRIPPLQLPGSRSTGARDYGRDYKSSYDGRSSRNGSHQLSSSTSSSRENSLLDNPQTQNVSTITPSLKSISQSSACSLKPLMSEEEFMKVLNTIFKKYLKEHVIESAALDIQQNFDTRTFAKFVRESINNVLEKSSADRERISRLMSYLISQNILPLQLFKSGFGEVLDIVDDLIIDIPKIWMYLAEILSHPIEEEVISLYELKTTFTSLKSQRHIGNFIGELLAKLSRDKEPKWVKDKWDQSGLQLNSVLDTEQENIDKIIKEYGLDFLTGDDNSAKSSTSNQLSLQQIHDHLRKLMKENTFDEICDWIAANVGSRVKEPQFSRILMTATVETSMEQVGTSWKLKKETFGELLSLISRYVDANDQLELQCLYAIQAHLVKLQYPIGILQAIVNKLFEDNIISSEAFLAWYHSTDPMEREGHGIVMTALTSFFTNLQEPDDASSVEEVSTSVNDGC